MGWLYTRGVDAESYLLSGIKLETDGISHTQEYLIAMYARAILKLVSLSDEPLREVYPTQVLDCMVHASDIDGVIDD
jgi:hypothetical protein